MENGGPVVGLDAPTAKSDVVELDNRDRGLEAADFLFARFPSSWSTNSNWSFSEWATTHSERCEELQGTASSLTFQMAVSAGAVRRTSSHAMMRLPSGVRSKKAA